MTSGLCLTSQLCFKNISVLFKSITVTSNYSLYLLILISRGATLVTFLFFVPFILKTLNKKLIGLVWILSSLTNYLLIFIYMYPELTNALTLKFFLFFVLTFTYMFNSFLALLYQLGIIYLFQEFTWKISHTISFPKFYFLFFSLLFSSSNSSWIFYFFINCFPLQSLAICPFLLYLKHF